MDDAVVAAMRQATTEATDASTRTGTFLLWRTEQILKAGDDGTEAKLPSRRTLYRLLEKIITGNHTTRIGNHSQVTGARGRHTLRGNCPRSRRVR